MEVLTGELKLRDEQNSILERKVKQGEELYSQQLGALRGELIVQQAQQQQALQNKLTAAMAEVDRLSSGRAYDDNNASIASQFSLM